MIVLVAIIQKLLQVGFDPGFIFGEAYDCPGWNDDIHAEVDVLCDMYLCDRVSHGVNVLTMEVGKHIPVCGFKHPWRDLSASYDQSLKFLITIATLPNAQTKVTRAICSTI